MCRAFKTVVFVIDQVDAFVRACKQTLLYNVLDALTSSQVQVGHTHAFAHHATGPGATRGGADGVQSAVTQYLPVSVAAERASVSGLRRSTVDPQPWPAVLCCAAQAVVFGVSCAYDVQDSMEKRVRSRFSNRKLFLPGLASEKVGTVQGMCCLQQCNTLRRFVATAGSK